MGRNFGLIGPYQPTLGFKPIRPKIFTLGPKKDFGRFEAHKQAQQKDHNNKKRTLEAFGCKVKWESTFHPCVMLCPLGKDL